MHSSNPCNRLEKEWGVHTFRYLGNDSRYVDCNLFAECHVMECPQNAVYHYDHQMCIPKNDDEVDDKAIAVLRYLEGGRLRRMKNQLQVEIIDKNSGSKKPLLDAVSHAKSITPKLIQDIERALPEEEK